MSNMELEPKLQQWLIAHNPGDEWAYKNAWWHQYVFIRDNIVPMFDTEYPKYKYLHGEKYFEAKKKSFDSFCQIVGTHMSKSLVHPVIKITYKKVTIVFRYNFYDYEVAVIGDVPIELPRNLIYSDGSSFFYQGFPEEYQIEARYFNRASTFIAGLRSEYGFYAFMLIVKDQIDKYRERWGD